MEDNPKKRVQSRKWLITINNPSDHNLSHDRIREIMSAVRGESLYWCMCDEEGDECETLHTHVFIYRGTPFDAQTIDNLFPKMHRDKSFGTAADNRAYVLKDGQKFNKDHTGAYNYTDGKGVAHIGVNYSDTFEEYGTLPEEHQGKSREADKIVSLIKDGATNREIIDVCASAYEKIEKIERTRSILRDADFANIWRELQVTYIFGKTGSGKTRGVMEKYGFGNCYRVTDYKHPFDTYDGQDVIIFDEFRSSLKISDMLNYLDGYPILLPCRYFNRQACFTKVFVISNIPLEDQFFNNDRESREAFYRRIHSVVFYSGQSIYREYESIKDYFTERDVPWLWN